MFVSVLERQRAIMEDGNHYTVVWQWYKILVQICTILTCGTNIVELQDDLRSVNTLQSAV